jgi:peptide/nickel transport system ATP-binding protein
VGETGAGKTTTAKAIMGLIPDPPGRITSGEVFYKGEDLLKKSNREMRSIRGKDISMIFQDPMSALNPTMKIVEQIAEVISLHKEYSEAEATGRRYACWRRWASAGRGARSIHTSFPAE